MFRTIADELRAPLTHLQIATELPERKSGSHPQPLERMHYEIERIEGLSSQVLALARAEKLQDSNESTSLVEVIYESATEFDGDFMRPANGGRFKG